MPIYTEPYRGTGRPLDLSDYQPTTGEVIRSSFGHALDTNPLNSIDILSRTNTDAAGSVFDGMADIAMTGVGGIVTQDFLPQRKPMPMEEQRKYLDESGVGAQLTPHESYDQEILDILIEAKKKENSRAFISERSTFLQGAAGLGAGFVAGMVDPINVASALIPVPGMGAARMMPLLARAKGPARRAGLRVMEGMASGALGAAVVEPLVYTGQQALQADYGLANSLMNIGFGAAMGAGMKAVHGAWREHRNVKTGRAQEWEYAPQSEATKVMREKLESEWFEAQKGTRSEAEWDTLRSEIADAVAVYDMSMRHIAYKEKILPEAVYDRYKIDFMSGEIYDKRVLEAQNLMRRYQNIPQEIADLEAMVANIGAYENLRIADPQAQIEELQRQLRTLPKTRKFKEALQFIEAERTAQESGPATLNQSLIPETAPTPRQTTHANISPTGSPRIQGDNIEVLVNTSISTKGDAAHYELRELEDVISSHDPTQGYRRRDNYPQAAQERPYHSDEGEQNKVRGNAITYNPRHVINTDPTAMSGPPVITRDGVVLGGNSRTMTLELVYAEHPEKAAAYRAELADKAQRYFGIDPAQIESMQRPILVRVLEDDLDAETTILKSREYNQVLTQEIQELAKGVSLGKKISQKSNNLLSEGMDEFDGSLTDFLNSGKSTDFIYSLIDDGVIMETERTSLVGKNGILNAKGKTLVRNAIRGRIVPDYDILNALPEPVLQKLDAAAPHVLRTQSFGKDWDISQVVFYGLRAITDANAAKRTLKHLFDGATVEGAGRKYGPKTRLFAYTFENAKADEIRIRMAEYAKEADKARMSSGLMSEVTTSPWDVLDRAFNTDLVRIGDAKILGYRPIDNQTHAAIQWAIANNCDTIKEAKLLLMQDLMKSGNDPEVKAQIIQRQDALYSFDGQIKIDQPKLQGFRERQYHELKGDSEEARLAWEENMRRRKEAEEKWRKEMEEKAKERARLRAEEQARKGQEEKDKPQQEKPAEETAPPEKTVAKAEEETAIQRQIDNFESARAAVTFISDNRAIIRFFKQADLTSGSHELFHVMARQLEDLAMRDGGDPYWRRKWDQINEFVGAKEGEAWTAEMHEKFARAGERYLLEGKAPTAQLEPVFERMRQRFLEVYVDADKAGLEISDGMRKLFDDMLTVPVIEGEQRIQRGIAALNSYRWEDSFYTGDLHAPADANLANLGDANIGRAVVDADTAELGRTLDMLEKSGNELDAALAKEIRENVGLLDKEIARAREKGRLLEEFVACNARFG